MPSRASVEEALKSSGYRLTPQRMMVLAAVEASNDHISVEEIHTQIKTHYPHVDVSTVYRTLELLERLGLVTKADLGEGRIRYHWAEKGQHHHLVCQKCGRVIELGNEVLQPMKHALQTRYGFVPDVRHLTLFGWCLSCWAKEEK